MTNILNYSQVKEITIWYDYETYKNYATDRTEDWQFWKDFLESRENE